MLYENWIRPWLFRLDPEGAHEKMTALMAAVQATPLGPRLTQWLCGPSPQGLETEVLGLKFPNPIGLAAGFDKDGCLPRIMGSMGFGFIEIGSVTLRPQPGNPAPRIFRYPQYKALINRLGFNNQGAHAIARRLEGLGPLKIPLGINLGLNKDAPKENAAAEYAEVFKILKPFGDYFVVNVSSPNTPGLRDLQQSAELKLILKAIQDENTPRKPVLVKVSPDLSTESLEELVELMLVEKLASGVIATNTTLSRDTLPLSLSETAGGLSGAPLRERSTAVIGRLYRLTQGKLPIIGVGGVFTGADAFEKIQAGANLVQLYTGLIYRGPAAAVRIQEELSAILHQSGFKSVASAVGTRS